MKLVFLAIGSEQLGISQLASIIKSHGHEVDLVFTASLFHDRYNLEIPWLGKFFDETDKVVKSVIDKKPDVIAFSCLTSTFQWALEIARKVKSINPNIESIFGGVHASAVPEVCLSYPEVNYVVVGEGENAIIDIIDDILAGKKGLPINNTQYYDRDGNLIKGKQVGFHQDLDSFPAPEKIMWEPYINLKNNYLMMCSRGCPYTCSFCFNNFFAKLPDGKRGKYVRQRCIENVIAELKWAKERYRIQCVDFEDDVFTVDKEWIREFCLAYKKEIDLPFICLIHAKYFDEDIARWLKEAGCSWIQMGIQTMDEEFKKENLQRRESNNSIISALKLMKKYKIKVKVDQMLALPNESIKAQEIALDIFKQYTPERIQTFWTCFLPGTDMLKEAIEANIINEKQVYRLNHGLDFYFFRNQDNIKNPDLVRHYINYEFIYRILPALPNFLKQRITAKRVDIIPVFLKNFIGKIVDVYIGLKTGNTDFTTYALLYLHHLIKFSLSKLGYNKYNLTKVYKDIPPPKFSSEILYKIDNSPSIEV